MSGSGSNLVSFSRSPDYWLMRARKRTSRAEHSAAGLLYRQVFEQTGHPAVMLQMAENYYQMGCYTAARRIAVDMLKDDRQCAPAYYWLGMTALKQKDEDLAEQAFAAALKTGHDLPLADDAQDMLSEYAWTEPNWYRRSQRAHTLYDRALWHLRAGDLLKTEIWLKRALLRGICPEAEALLGEILLSRKQYAPSARYLERARLRLPGQPSVLLLLAQAQSALGMEEESRTSFMSALDLVSTDQEWSMAAAASFPLRQLDAVRQRLRAALSHEPESNDLLYVLAALEADSGNAKDAFRYLNAILTRDPDDRDAKAAMCLIGYGLVPLFRIGDDEQLIDSLFSPESIRQKDAALFRLAHGLTISMGGAATYQEVLSLSSLCWDRLNPIQKVRCDRQNQWPNAMYRAFSKSLGIDDLPYTAALWPYKKYDRRIRRMSRYITSILDRKGVTHRE